MTDYTSDWLAAFVYALMPWIIAAREIPWLVVGGQIVAVLIAATLLHRFVTPVLQRLTARLPFSSRLVRYGHRTGEAVVFLYLVQLILRNAPDSLAGIETVRHLNALALVGALTWFGVRCVRAIGDTIVEIHPADDVANVQARRIQTQTRVLSHSMSALIILVGCGMAFSTLPLMRQIGTTLLASAGVAGLVVGFAAKPVLGNLLAGMQLALTQPIRLGDVVIAEQEWGWIDEITGTYVVIRIWDERRLIVPLQWFIEHPFQNWTRDQTAILGTVMVWADYRMPVEPVRKEAERICRNAPEWDRRVCVTQVVDASERAMQMRILVSAADAGLCWDLRCRVREEIVAFIQRDYPGFLPRIRAEVAAADAAVTAPRK
jgi:small-conductance mechanosensitive channel